VSELELSETLERLERELHQLETRRNVSRLEELLHPDFVEFGRSGRIFSRNDVLAEFSEITAYPAVVVTHFRVDAVSECVALATYISAHVGPTEGRHRHSLRSSLWVHGTRGWQMRFHQGTPADG
jgi:hypothetical protein